MIPYIIILKVSSAYYKPFQQHSKEKNLNRVRAPRWQVMNYGTKLDLKEYIYICKNIHVNLYFLSSIGTYIECSSTNIPICFVHGYSESLLELWVGLKAKLWPLKCFYQFILSKSGNLEYCESFEGVQLRVLKCRESMVRVWLRVGECKNENWSCVRDFGGWESFRVHESQVRIRLRV